MKITVIAVGKLKETFWKEACGEYAKRLRRYVPLEIIELDDIDPDKHGGPTYARELEAAAIVKSIPRDSRIICLDRQGKQLDSEGFADLVANAGTSGCKNLVFIIGGPTGLDISLMESASMRLSFGKITLPHNLARVVLLEQIYRAHRIIRGEPYHK
ncbi:MAG: 23S rRNA (pseudouridine(1915)-N(3))-methyltransferase RlmH [bacterium]|nr:23S rRNA (pseudouridine(1915)-N(3))-methyltransferase RlmH [bacterium]